MSGTKGYKQREKEKLRTKIENLMALNTNRTALLNVTVAELKALYGAENVNIGHPLFDAIQASAEGVVINLEQLAADITTFKIQELE